MTSPQLRKVPSARSIARLMTLKRDYLTKAETVTVAAIEAGVLALAEEGLNGSVPGHHPPPGRH